ncbi:hypothetical protein [Proteus terrae]|uniref:hypothetical protein n=1 Tax=Proteus terrae TaxID=1574161 RepID=UPI00298C86DA|nr:hypothetical protein [Proteus terrae]WPD00666.1 hypothetical protein R5P25_09195 [Proteus terrae]
MLVIKDDGKYAQEYIELTSDQVKGMARTPLGEYYQGALLISIIRRSVPGSVGPIGHQQQDPILGRDNYFVVFCFENKLFLYSFIPVINSTRDDWSTNDIVAAPLNAHRVDDDDDLIKMVQGIEFPHANEF